MLADIRGKQLAFCLRVTTICVQIVLYTFGTVHYVVFREVIFLELRINWCYIGIFLAIVIWFSHEDCACDAHSQFGFLQRRFRVLSGITQLLTAINGILR